MKISTIKELLDAEVICCEEGLKLHVYSAFGSDMMSDVLAYVKDQMVLLTGLVNPQVIRTAVMMDMNCIVFVRSKQPTEEMIELALEAENKYVGVSCGKLDQSCEIYCRKDNLLYMDMMDDSFELIEKMNTINAANLIKLGRPLSIKASIAAASRDQKCPVEDAGFPCPVRGGN